MSASLYCTQTKLSAALEKVPIVGDFYWGTIALSAIALD